MEERYSRSPSQEFVDGVWRSKARDDDRLSASLSPPSRRPSPRPLERRRSPTPPPPGTEEEQRFRQAVEEYHRSR